MLKALAKVLGTTQAYLQAGGAPGTAPDRLNDIKERLHEQLLAGNPRTLQFIETVRYAEQLGAVPASVVDDDAVELAAQAIEIRLGSAQLTNRHDQLEEVGALTGWELAELLKPAGAHSHWLVVSEGMMGGVTQIERGTSRVVSLIRSEVSRWVQSRSCDSRAIFTEDTPWFRIQLEEPWQSELAMTISFVRCEPTETSLRYSQPGELERWYLIRTMASELGRSFNYVRDIGDLSPWPRYEDMRLELLAISDRGEHAQPRSIALFSGTVKDHVDVALRGVKGCEHQVVMTWLTSRLDEELLPHLAHWPRICWQPMACSQGITLELDTPWHVASELGREPISAPQQFMLRLVEARQDGTCRELPWSDKSIEAVLARVKSAVEKLPEARSEDQFEGPLPASDFLVRSGP